MLDPCVDDATIVAEFGLASGVSPALIDQVCPDMATLVSEVVPAMDCAGCEIVVTPELVEWMGGVFFRLGLHADLEPDFLVYAAGAITAFADPDDARGEPVRQRLAELVEAGASDLGQPALDEQERLHLLCSIVFDPRTIRRLLFGLTNNSYAPWSRFAEALRQLLADSAPHPDMPLIARRVAAMLDAAEDARKRTATGS